MPEQTTEMSVTTNAGQSVQVNIEAICGNCVHWIKNATGEIGVGICFALPATVVLKGNAFVKVRGSYQGNERGCTALFSPRPEVVQLAVASSQGAANQADGPH